MTTAQAVRFHQDKLDFSILDMANNSINPKPRAVSYLRELWLKDNHGTLGGETMFSSIQKYAESNPNSHIEFENDENGFVIVLVTEFMFKIHHEFRESGEVIFVDTTSHVDQLNTALTPLLCASPIGGLPLGVIFTSSQAETSYTKGKFYWAYIYMAVIFFFFFKGGRARVYDMFMSLGKCGEHSKPVQLF